MMNPTKNTRRDSAASNTPSIAGKFFAASLVLVAPLGVPMAANASELTDKRGYENCVSTLDTRDLSGVTFPRQYFIARQADSTSYYVNAQAWENGVRVAKRLTCQTSKSGRVVLSAESGDGRYARADNASPSIAQR